MTTLGTPVAYLSSYVERIDTLLIKLVFYERGGEDWHFKRRFSKTHCNSVIEIRLT